MSGFPSWANQHPYICNGCNGAGWTNKIRTTKTCSTCGGTGANPQHPNCWCVYCKGKGQVLTEQVIKCQPCGGTGVIRR